MLTITFGLKISVNVNGDIKVVCDFTDEMVSMPPKILLQLISTATSVLTQEISILENKDVKKWNISGDFSLSIDVTGDVASKTNQYIGSICHADQLERLTSYEQIMLLTAAKTYLINSGVQIVSQDLIEQQFS